MKMMKLGLLLALTGCKTTQSGGELQSDKTSTGSAAYGDCRGLASGDLGIVDGSLKFAVTDDKISFSWTKDATKDVENFNGSRSSVSSESIEFAGFTYEECDLRVIIQGNLATLPQTVDMLIMCAEDAFHADFTCKRT